MKRIKKNQLLHVSALRCLIEAIPDAIFLKDGAGRWLITNATAKTLFKLKNIPWQGKTDSQLAELRPEMQEIHKKCMDDDELAWSARKLVVCMQDIADENSNICQYEVRKSPIFDKNGGRKALIVIGRDVTESKIAEANLLIADTAIESLEAIVITDANNKILRVNSSFTKLTGYSADEVIGKSTAILKSGRHNKSFYERMWKSLSDKKHWEGEVWDRRKNGEIYPKWLTISAVISSSGQTTNYVGAFIDLSEHKHAEEAIHHLAYYDPLTNLPNRRLLNDRLRLALENSAYNQSYGAVLLIDLDHFKKINDTKGHAVGDLLLIEVGQRLLTCVRQVDTVSRLGGDEFVIVLDLLSTDPDLAANQAEIIGNKLLRAINKPFLISGEEFYSSLSIGISLFTFPTSTSEELLKRADAAMYQAKAAGRNTFRFFDSNEHASLESQLKIETELRQAVNEDQLEIHYQAQVDHDGKVLGAEALVRWQHPSNGLMPPNDFIPLAEESGLIIQIGNWVISTACLQLKKWEDNLLTKDLTIAVNVSPKQFCHPKFVFHITQILADTKAKATHLKLEITESLVLQNMTSVIEKMHAIKELGIQFSIDDFGTGYSSLSYLMKLPISQLKIDRSFICDINTDKNAAVITQTIIGMANNLGFNVIAEGVETLSQRNVLKNYGCLSYQGYLYSKPLPLAEFEQFLDLINVNNALQLKWS